MTVVKPQRRADCTAVRQACQRTVLVCEAKGGEILVSSLLKELTESAGDTAFGEGRQVELKGNYEVLVCRRPDQALAFADRAL